MPVVTESEHNQEIISLAEDIAGVLTPVEPSNIASAKEDVSLVFGCFGDAFDGLIEWRDGRFWIYCNLVRSGQRDSPRARFTLAHELGHYFIDAHRNALMNGLAAPHPSFSEFQSDELTEREADMFASHLLMPSNLFLKVMRTAPIGMEGIFKLKNRFKTSLTSTALRYVKSADFFCVVVKWNPNGFGWRWTSQEAHHDRYIRTVRSSTNLPHDSATRIAMSGAASDNGFIQRGAVASMWFDYVGAGGARDEILIEQAVSLGPHGFLTLLFPAKEIL